jgi:hypothetical protein
VRQDEIAVRYVTTDMTGNRMLYVVGTESEEKKSRMAIHPALSTDPYVIAPDDDSLNAMFERTQAATSQENR